VVTKANAARTAKNPVFISPTCSVSRTCARRAHPESRIRPPGNLNLRSIFNGADELKMASPDCEMSREPGWSFRRKGVCRMISRHSRLVEPIGFGKEPGGSNIISARERQCLISERPHGSRRFGLGSGDDCWRIFSPSTSTSRPHLPASMSSVNGACTGSVSVADG
jgi:hypothetical protein